MPRTNVVNAVDDELAAPVAAPDLTIEVVDGALLPPVPFYLVVDPFNDTQGREYMLCTLAVGTTLTVTRNLAGSDSDIHDAGDIVRITIAAQHIEDIWDGIDGVPPQTFLHDDLTDVTPSQHHPRYVDAEAVDAMGAIGDLNPLHHDRYTDAEALIQAETLDHDHATPIGVHAAIPEVHHSRYTDTEAIAAVGPIPPPQTFLHADLTDVGSLPSAHHAKYLDSEARSAVDDGTYLKRAGDSMAGVLSMNLHQLFGIRTPLVDSDAANKKYVDDNSGGGGDFLPLAGGSMAGNINMTVNNIDNVFKMDFRNSFFDPSGFIESFDTSGRQIFRIGAGSNSGVPNEQFIQITGINDTGTAAIQFRHGGLATATFRIDAIFMEPVADNTSGEVANTVVAAGDGLFQRSTSARKYKSDIQPAPQLADLTLVPVTFHHDGDDKDYIGFIADDMPIEEAIVRHDDEVENYDLRAVVAILAAKVNRMENA